MNIHRHSILFSAFSLGLLGSACAQQYHFEEVPAGLSIFGSPTLYSVTDKGQYLVVFAQLSGGGSAYVFTGKNLIEVPCNSGDFLFAMSTPGYFVGYGNQGSFIQNPEGIQTLITGSTGQILGATNINNLNEAIGGGSGASGNPFGFFWSKGALTTYNYPNSSSTSFNGGNDLGDAVGSYSPAASTVSIPFAVIKKTGKTTTIMMPDYTNIFPAMLNNSDLVVGSAVGTTAQGQVGWYMAAKGKLQTFSFGTSAPVALPGPKGPLSLQRYGEISNVWGVNNLGWICGSYIASYEDVAGGYSVEIPFVALP